MNDTNLQEIRKKLSTIITQHKLEKYLNTEKLEKEIYSSNISDNTELLTKVMTILDKNSINIDEVNKILQVVMDLWNYAPHKELEGKSPHEKAIELYGKIPTQEDVSNPIQNMKFDHNEILSQKDVEFPIIEIEKLQKPFAEQINNILIPEYLNYLATKYKQKTIERHIFVAGLFLNQALFAGFREYSQIDDIFAFDHFPVWWQSHVTLKMSETAVENSIVKFINFMYNKFKLNIFREDGSNTKIENNPIVSPYY